MRRSTAHRESGVDAVLVLSEAGWEIRRDIIDLAADIGFEHGLTLNSTVFDGETCERRRVQNRSPFRDIEQERIRL